MDQAGTTISFFFAWAHLGWRQSSPGEGVGVWGCCCSKRLGEKKVHDQTPRVCFMSSPPCPCETLGYCLGYDQNCPFVRLCGTRASFARATIVSDRSDRPTDRPIRPTDLAGRLTDRPTDRPAGRPTDRPTDRPAGRPTDRPTVRPVDGSNERTNNRSIERASERASERSIDRKIKTKKGIEQTTKNKVNSGSTRFV